MCILLHFMLLLYYCASVQSMWSYTYYTYVIPVHSSNPNTPTFCTCFGSSAHDVYLSSTGEACNSETWEAAEFVFACAFQSYLSACKRVALHSQGEEKSCKQEDRCSQTPSWISQLFCFLLWANMFGSVLIRFGLLLKHHYENTALSTF